jgi:prepilin-type N-terminal cleavage/methylation domain-containing protein
MKRPSLPTDHIIPDARGFTFFEIIMALLILAIAIVPMMNAFAPALLATGQGEEQAVLTGQARRTMNRLLDLDFRSLDVNQGNPANLVALFGSQAEVDKESFVYLGVTYPPPVVTIADASAGAGSLLELTVTLKTVSLRSLKANR